MKKNLLVIGSQDIYNVYSLDDDKFSLFYDGDIATAPQIRTRGCSRPDAEWARDLLSRWTPVILHYSYEW